MAAVLNAHHILKGLGHLPSNANHLCCNAEDDNNNNADIPEDPCLLTVKKTYMAKQETTHEERSERVQTQAKEHQPEDAQTEESTTAIWNISTKLQSAALSNNSNQTDKAMPKPKASVSVTAAKSSIFEKWAAMDRDSQRPLAKRQLSDESRARTSRARKKTMVREEKVQPSTGHSASQRENMTTLARPWSRRKLQKELLSHSDFCRVDTYAVETGKELKSKKIFSVQTIAQAITEGASTDLERLRAIWIWLCHNIEYDVTGYLGLTEKVCSPERVIETGRGVCCGYSSLCLQMCKEVGIECREVGGHGKGVGYRQGQSYQNTKSSHMWNAVSLEGYWYLLDACWGAGTVDMDNKAFIKRYDDFYFLTDPEDFINSHCPDEEEWQLLESPIKLEEFEKRVLKTSEFYRLGLTLIHPKHFSLITEDGEASISVGFSQPVDFTYQISQRSGSEQKELSSSLGLLTVAQSSMKLRVLPPTAGTFDVMLFARPGNTSGLFSWVCSFLLECPEPKPAEHLPENPYLCWGIQQNAEALGVKSCKYGSEAIVLKSGTFELVLQTARPLMMLCELIHKDLDKALSKRCLANQTEMDKLTCNILCPYTGYYRLSIFVRDYERAGDSFQNAGNFLLHCTSNPVNLNELFPPALSNCCGPGIRTSEAGLSKFSHQGAIVSTQQGKCNITFQNQYNLDLHAILTKEQHKVLTYPLSRYIFFTHNGTKVTVSITLPEPGVYKLGLYGKSTSSQDFSPLCDFIIHNSSENAWPPFPCPYSDWQKGSVLLEPRSGLLEPLSWVQFRVKVPGVHRVSALAEQRVDLQLNKSRVWEGEVFTGTAAQVKLAASQEENSNQMAILMCFDVLQPRNEM
ncbi:kyphoscoliosis peptidase [Colossoma macropomum]|uniref:kyphoscoliosis peptidase n=1 Tax=Colossoma macropomum TaxID=42526 RepID=UPI001864F52F|nr:kyphoscoliosis peptidase [Colossoma macropomum]